MNIQRVSLTDKPSVSSSVTKKDIFSSSGTRSRNYYSDNKSASDALSTNHIVTGTVVGGIIGALFHGNTKSFMNIALSSLRGAAIALLGIVAFKCVTSFMQSGSHK